MVSYQLKIVVVENDFDEFIDSLLSISGGIRKEKGCLDFCLYRALIKKDSYIVLVEWKTHQAMEKHFKHKLFTVLIGVSKVLGKDFEITIGETLEKGSYQLAREKITLNPKKGKTVDEVLNRSEI